MFKDSDEIKYLGRRERLVHELKQKGIKNSEVLKAILNVPRHNFFRDDLRHLAYNDNAYPIEANQTISQPYTVAYQTALLGVEPKMKVLEIGTGSGYQAAILCEMGAKVFSIERQGRLYYSTLQRLKRMGYILKLIYGDGYEGCPEEAPFDRILITAAAPEVPSKLLSQLAIGGCLVVPVGKRQQVMMRITRVDKSNFDMEKFGTFAFVPMLKGKV